MDQVLSEGSRRGAIQVIADDEQGSSSAVSDAVESGGALTPGAGELGMHAAEKRRELLKRELDRYLYLLTTQSDPEQIIVFGSMASGEVTAWSDIDLVIVQQTSLPFLKRSRQVRRLLKPRVGTDILVYTPAEFEQLHQTRPFFRDEILAKGVVLYARAS